MRFLRGLPMRLWHLFVDDGRFVVLLLAWVVPACLVLPRIRIGAWSGPALFAGIAVVTFLSLRPRS